MLIVNGSCSYSNSLFLSVKCGKKRIAVTRYPHRERRSRRGEGRGVTKEEALSVSCKWGWEGGGESGGAEGEGRRILLNS